MPRGRPRQPQVNAAVPLRLGLLDATGTPRALADDYAELLAEYLNLNFGEADHYPTDPHDVEAHMMSDGWTIQRVTKEWLPRFDGHCLAWNEELRPERRGGGAVVRLR